MGHHHTTDTGIEQGPEGYELHRIELGPRLENARKIIMGVYIHIAMAGKMLGACQDAGILHAFHIGNTEAGYFFFVLPERPITDHRIVGIVIDINDRGIVHVYAQPFALLSYRQPHPIHQSLIVHRPKG